jgi:Na+-transporting NADH:ubiquinone oxidoreductase subunit B
LVAVKFLENIIHKMEPKFAKGAKLEKWNPLFETMATFAFTPKLVTQKGSHIRDGVDLKRTMMTVILAMIPCLLFGIYNTGHFAEVAKGSALAASYWDGLGVKFTSGLIVVLPLLVVSYGVGLLVEFVFGMIRGHALHEGFLVSGMLIPLVMPADVPLWMVAVATIFAVVIGKEVFGGTGMNVVNIALTARAFLFFAYPTSMSGDKVWLSGNEVDGVSGSTALGDLASFMSDKPVFENLDAYTAKYSLMDSFFGMIPGSIGETSTLACLFGAMILVLTGVGSLRIIASFFAGGYVMGIILNAVGGNAYLDLPAHFHLVIGGFAFGAVFMATDPVTAAQTATGKIIYGFMGGILAIMIRVLNPAYPEGVMLAILFMNVTAPIIDHYVIQSNIKRRLKRTKTA